MKLPLHLRDKLRWALCIEKSCVLTDEEYAEVMYNGVIPKINGRQMDVFEYGWATIFYAQEEDGSRHHPHKNWSYIHFKGWITKNDALMILDTLIENAEDDSYDDGVDYSIERLKYVRDAILGH